MCKMGNEFQNIIAVTNRMLCRGPFLKQVERVCTVQPKALLLREKDLPEAEYGALAREVLAICMRYEVPCILHSYPDAAEKTGADKLHLPLAKLRELKAEGWNVHYDMLGCSIHSLEEAREAEMLGATYLTAGHIYATDCKKGVPPRGLSFLREVCAGVEIPVYAIGGIRMELSGNPAQENNERKISYHTQKVPCMEQMKEIMECGASGACIMSGMMQM